MPLALVSRADPSACMKKEDHDNSTGISISWISGLQRSASKQRNGNIQGPWLHGAGYRRQRRRALIHPPERGLIPLLLISDQMKEPCHGQNYPDRPSLPLVCWFVRQPLYLPDPGMALAAVPSGDVIAFGDKGGINLKVVGVTMFSTALGASTTITAKIGDHHHQRRGTVGAVKVLPGR